MIEFNTLNISQKGDILTIEASVINSDYYTNVYIDKIIIDTQDTYIASGPSTNNIYEKIIEDNSKTIKVELNKQDLNTDLNTNLFFVYIVTKGTPSSDTPCGQDNINTVGVIYNSYPIYQNMMNYIKEVSNTCCIPRNFIDSILQLNALDLCIKTSNYIQAIKYWNLFFKKSIKVVSNGCCI